MDRREPVPPQGPAPRPGGQRAGDARRGLRHHDRRARLAGGGHQPERPAAHPRRGAGRARRSRGGRDGRLAGPSGCHAEVRGSSPGQARRSRGRRPRHAGDLQQPLHVGGGADGGPTAGHGALGQHQGTAGLLVRDLRRGRQPYRQCPAHPGAPGIDGREHQDRRGAQRGPHQARRRLRAERPLPRRHAPAGHYRRHPRLRRRRRAGERRAGGGEAWSRERDSLLCRIAGPPRRGGRDHARLDACVQHPRGGGGRSYRQLAPGARRRAARARDLAPVALRALSVAQSGHEHRRLAGEDRRQREGRARTAPDDRAARPGRRAGLHGLRAAERRGGGAPGHPRAARRQLFLRARQWRSDQRGGAHRPARAQRRDRLHWHLTAVARQLQRSIVCRHGGGALRVPDPGRRGHPAEFRLPHAGPRDHPVRKHALAPVSGGRRRGQRRDLAGHHRSTVRSSRRHG